MVGKPKLRTDLPAIDLRRKSVKGIFGNTKMVATSKREQRKMKKALMTRYPDRYYIDDLGEWNSIKARELKSEKLASADPLSWIDDLEMLDIMTDIFEDW